jgi:FPC/CPF motif-containing protein YcgG
MGNKLSEKRIIQKQSKNYDKMNAHSNIGHYGNSARENGRNTHFQKSMKKVQGDVPLQRGWLI